MIARAAALADRSSLAKETKRKLADPNWIASIVQEARVVASSLQTGNDDSLSRHTDRLKQFLRSGTETCDREFLTMAAGGVLESVRRSIGLNLFDVQIHAGVVVSCGAVAEMQTGEGKTLSGTIPAYVQGLSGRGVHVSTTNGYLAKRDYEKLTPVFQSLGMTTGLLSDDATEQQSRVAYQQDITYGPGHTFGFDYLRDQLSLKQLHNGPMGSVVLDRVSSESVQSRLLQRGLHAAIVDEIDHVLIDDAVSPLLLSSSSMGVAPDAEIHQQAKKYCRELVRDEDFVVTPDRVIELTQRGFDRVYEQTDLAISNNLIRPWHEYVILALKAKCLFVRDVHYVVRDDAIQLVDASTGRIFQDRTWSDGLHQAVLCAEGLEIIPESEPLARITRQRFYRYYQTLGGMTGTATGCDNEFARVYGLAISVVPLRRPSRRTLLDEIITESDREKAEAIGHEVQQMHNAGRPVLIGTLNIAQSQSIANELDRRNVPFQMLNGVQDADEAEIVAQAGTFGAVTVATNLAGRGTDIPLDSRTEQLGGLHVIVTERHSLSRVDRQLIGRCARCGDPGTARYFLSADDDLVQKHAPWVGRAISRCVRREKLDSAHRSAIQKQLLRAQAAQQQAATHLRLQLLKLDQDTETLLDHAIDPAECWQI